MVSSYVGSMTQQLSPRQLHLSQSWPLVAPSQGSASDRGSSCEYEVPLPYSAAQPAWDLTLEPFWKITASLKGSRQDGCAAAAAACAATPASAPLSPLAQRAANAAVRAAAGWLSPGQWRSAQLGGSVMGHCSSPCKATPQPRSSAAAVASATPPACSEDGLVAFRPRRWLAGGASDLESSISALADALGALQSGAFSQSEAFPSLADTHPPSRPVDACSWQAPQPLSSRLPCIRTAANESTEEWEDGEGSVDGELGRSGDVDEEEAPLQLQRSGSSEFFSACSGSLSASEERSSSAETSPTQALPSPQQAPLATVPASTIRQNLLDSFPAEYAAEASATAEEEPASPKPAPQQSSSQVPIFSPFAMAAVRGASERGPGLQTPFATACTASPFEAPSPRDMHLSPAEERLVPTPSLGANGLPADAAEGCSPREQAERERATRMLACLWANTEKAPWVEAQAAQPQEAGKAEGGKREQPLRPAAPPSCAAQHKSGSATGKRLFGIVGDGQSEWQPLVRESNQVMELAGLDTDWLLHDLLVFADAVYA